MVTITHRLFHRDQLARWYVNAGGATMGADNLFDALKWWWKYTIYNLTRI